MFRLGICSNDVDEIPGDVAGLVHRTQFGDGFGGAFVPYDADAGITGDVRFDISVQLRFLIRASPGNEGHFLGGCSPGYSGECASSKQFCG
jgi:hypothetical protein